ncbi:MAG: Spy/CpxP family protein refolding chaperone [Rhizobiales bacterium]|nr:Spy/CpxP family protein refolding chaperone [Hyphomicrobiales bacterium]
MRFPIGLSALALASVLGAAAIAQTGPATPPPGAPPAPPFAQGGPGGPTPQQVDEMRIRREAMRDARRAMMAEGRIAALRGGLALRADQQALWKPVEDALRAMTTMRGGQQPAAGDDPIARMRAGAERMRARADALSRLADASQALYATLSDEQKVRLKALTERGGMNPGMHPGMGPGRHPGMRRGMGPGPMERGPGMDQGHRPMRGMRGGPPPGWEPGWGRGGGPMRGEGPGWQGPRDRRADAGGPRRADPSREAGGWSESDWDEGL